MSACAAIGVVIVSTWMASPREKPLTLLAPASVEDVERGHRESAALEPAPSTPTSATREAPPAPGIRGRLIEASTGAPLVGWKIELRHATEPTFVVSTPPVSLFMPTFEPPTHPDSNTIRFGTDLVTTSSAAVQLERNTATTLTLDTLFTQSAAQIERPENSEEQTASAENLRLLVRALQDTSSSAPNAVEQQSTQDSTPAEVASSDAVANQPTSPTIFVPEFAIVAPAAPTENDGALRPSDEEIRTKIIPVIEEVIQRRQSEGLRTQLTFALLQNQTAESRLRTQLFVAPSGPYTAETAPSCAQAECVTDAEGRFELPCPDSDESWLQLEPRPPLYPDSTRYPLHKIVDACARPIEWKTHVVERATVNARVLDAATGEPVPFLDVVLSGDDRSEVLVTDVDGRCASTKLFATGRVRVGFRDGPQECSEGRDYGAARIVDVRCDPTSDILDASGAELTFRAAIGPTYRFTLPNGLEPDLVLARLHGVVAKDPRDASSLDGEWHAMRREGEWFVRSPVPLRAAPGAVPALDVWTCDMQRAHVELHHLEGRGDVVELTLELGARLRGEVVDHEYSSVGGARVELIGRDGSTLDAVTTDDDGAWQFVGVDPSTFSRIEVHFNGASRRASAPLQAGDDREIDMVLDDREH